MEFFKKRGVALVVLMLAIAGAVFIGQSRKDGFIAKKPTELLDVQYQDWICDEAGLLNGETEQLIRDYNDSWNSKYYAITAVASIDHLTSWDAEDYAANLGEKWGLGRNDMILLLVKDGGEAFLLVGSTKLTSFVGKKPAYEFFDAAEDDGTAEVDPLDFSMM